MGADKFGKAKKAFRRNNQKRKKIRKIIEEKKFIKENNSLLFNFTENLNSKR